MDPCLEHAINNWNFELCEHFQQLKIKQQDQGNSKNMQFLCVFLYGFQQNGYLQELDNNSSNSVSWSARCRQRDSVESSLTGKTVRRSQLARPTHRENNNDECERRASSRNWSACVGRDTNASAAASRYLSLHDEKRAQIAANMSSIRDWNIAGAWTPANSLPLNELGMRDVNTA